MTNVAPNDTDLKNVASKRIQDQIAEMIPYLCLVTGQRVSNRYTLDVKITRGDIITIELIPFPVGHE